ncbi:hypothetical protein Slin15195_G038050 [Septoria linicola]|uniref:Uncharacterized protein n=1 Tax=Septoria linicola TaxID=215465 RepID=A0A9Q9ATK1_9PEZI|nr:hypothetical protein Slin14017_G119450 [Septoria linicola]USW50486.1 hypothetical protein Slin15195_G038050 [Septoria linicola]
MVAKKVASFAPVSDTQTAIFGAPNAVEAFSAKLELGHIGHKSVSESQPYDRSIMALSTALDDVMRGHDLPALGLWPAIARTSPAYWIRAEKFRAWKDRKQAKQEGVLTWQAIKTILDILPAQITEDAAQSVEVGELQLGVCIRSSYYGGYVVLCPDNADKTTVWLINEDAEFSPPNDWHFGELWSAVASPKATGDELDGSTAEVYGGLKRRLLEGAIEYARTNSPSALEQRPGSSGIGAQASRSRSRAVYSRMSDTQADAAAAQMLSLAGFSAAHTKTLASRPTQAASQNRSHTDAASIQSTTDLSQSENSSSMPKGLGTIGRKLTKVASQMQLKQTVETIKHKASLARVGVSGATASGSRQGITGGAVTEPPKGQKLTPSNKLLSKWGQGEYYYIGGDGDTYTNRNISGNQDILDVLASPLHVDRMITSNRDQPVYCGQSALATLRDPQANRADRTWLDLDGPCGECEHLNRSCWLVVPGKYLIIKGMPVEPVVDSHRMSGDNRGRPPPSRPGSSVAVRNIIAANEEAAAAAADEDHAQQEDADDDQQTVPDDQQSTSRHMLTSAPEGTSIKQPPPGETPVIPAHYGRGVMIWVGPPGAGKIVHNAEHFTQESVSYLQKSWTKDGKGSRRDYAKMRVQCINVNRAGPIKKDFLSAATSRQKVAGWANVDSACNECDSLKNRECFLFVNEDVVWYKHNANY